MPTQFPEKNVTVTGKIVAYIDVKKYTGIINVTFMLLIIFSQWWESMRGRTTFIKHEGKASAIIAAKCLFRRLQSHVDG